MVLTVFLSDTKIGKKFDKSKWNGKKIYSIEYIMVYYIRSNVICQIIIQLHPFEYKKSAKLYPL